MKKLFALTLALMMVLSMATVAFADQTSAVGDDQTEKGSIAINGASANNTYEIYKMLDLESYNTVSGAYSYKANAAWAAYFATDEAKAYFSTDKDGYVTWTWKAPENLPESDTTTPRTEAEASAKFAKLALAYAEANGINPVRSTANKDDEGNPTDYVTIEGGIKFEDLELGYYLIDSTMGALCGLTTTNPNAAITAKNSAPTIDKQVEEDSTHQYGDKNTADIGQTVKFRTTINVHAGAQNYVLHDKMSAGLTFKEVTKIEHVIPNVSTTEVDSAYYTVKTADLGDDCTFHIVFTQAFCDHLATNDKVIVYYDAMLNRNAIIADEGNSNESKLEFGEGHESNIDQTTTNTFGFDLVKTDSQGIKIDGAKFKIYDAATGGNEVAVVLMDDGVTYCRAREDETGIEIEVKDGQVRVVGFDNGTYYLEETEAPDGYNKLTGRQGFTISDGNLDASFDVDGKISAGSGVQVVNKTGSMLPETGAMGTLIFISFGMIVALATGVLLVTRKRMSMIED